MADHAAAERRSLRYHSAIADRLEAEPALLERARRRVEAWLRERTVAEYYAAGWRDVLASPAAEIRAFLVDRSERARAFRQVTPFAGALDPRERWRLWAAAKDEDDETAA
jgi:hypothetical protein